MSINSINGNTLLTSGSFPPVRAASTGSPLTPTTGGLLVVDGIQLVAGDRVLCKDEASAVNNGIYAASTGPWVRTSDAAGNQNFFSGMAVTVALGAVNAGFTYICTTTDDPVVVGTSNITFVAQSIVATATQLATSTTSLTIGTGSKTLAIAAGKAFAANQYVVIYETSNVANSMLAQITSYSGTSLVVNSVATGGSGTHADWTIVLTNAPAAAGIQPPVGSGNVTGPGSSTANHFALFADGTGKLLQDGGTNPTFTGGTFTGAAAFQSTVSITGKLSLTSTDSVAVANGTTGQRNGAPAAGDFRYNSTLNCFEGWNATSWVQVGAAPTVQRITAGAANYTPSTGTVRIRVRMAGGGGGGGAADTNNGSNGVDTQFGSWTAIHGNGGTVGGAGGAGGTGGANGTGTLVARFSGANGGPAISNSAANTSASSGAGGSSMFGGAAPAVTQGNAGLNAAANTGSGGSGGSKVAAGTNSGSGGGAGEYVEFWITNPGVTAYSVGAGGNGGAAGTQAGGAGAAGIIIVEEFYL